MGNQPLQGPFTLLINPPEVLPAMEALGEFTSLISNTLSPPSPFELLPPPTTVGFLKLSRPCCYVFPAGRGDCAFFAVNGFTMLVDGGSDSQACFWKLVRHLDRVDAVLLTHIGTENLPGVNAFLERKVAELELSSEIKGKDFIPILEKILKSSNISRHNTVDDKIFKTCFSRDFSMILLTSVIFTFPFVFAFFFHFEQMTLPRGSSPQSLESCSLTPPPGFRWKNILVSDALEDMQFLRKNMYINIQICDSG